ncbi:MAG: ferrous iron transport protein B [Caldiserica bacterium]|nr:ferrous iron transport protein B [Caldisericota bacterium]
MNKTFTVVLAGNANVGKSVIFNQLTGGSQIVGNWPGKTVEKAEGFTEQGGIRIRIIDLPGIYSLSTYSEEEIVTREFIAKKHPDLVVDIIDASNLERNLFFLFQLIELEIPIVVALNQYDVVEEKGFEIDDKKLSELLGIPVVKTVATRNRGLRELFQVIADMLKTGKEGFGKVRYGKEVEERIAKLSKVLEKFQDISYPLRFVAIKLLEKDPLITSEIKSPEIISLVENLVRELEDIHGEKSETVIISERYSVASRIAGEVLEKMHEAKHDVSDSLDKVALHRFWGYVMLLGVVLFIFFVVFKFGSYLSDIIGSLFSLLKPYFMHLNMSNPLKELLWNGAIEGVIAGFAIVLPYIAPFYLILSILEDSGYLARVAFLTDNLMHRLGVHGKAFIPLIESFGCNVPAIMGSRVMERKRDRLIVSILATLIPCSARTVVIFGLVAVFLGPLYAILIYVFDFILIFIVGLLLNKYIKGMPTGLIMEMPRFRKPVFKVIFRQTWIRLKEFFYFAMPIIITANIVMEGLILLKFIGPVTTALSPISTFLGLPPLATITLLFGVLRKELTLIMLATFYQTTNFAKVLTPQQIFIFGFVTMIYIPCVATIAALKREFGNLTAFLVSIGEFIGALLIGGLLNLLLRIF